MRLKPMGCLFLAAVLLLLCTGCADTAELRSEPVVIYEAPNAEETVNGYRMQEIDFPSEAGENGAPGEP